MQIFAFEINNSLQDNLNNFYYFYQNSIIMRKSIIILFIGVLISMTSCRKDFDTVPSTGTLEFSDETVYLDTVFTKIGSSTYTLKVYNRSNNDIKIPSIHLAKADTKYRIMVDGMTGIDSDNSGVGDGKVFNNVELLAKDSMYVFIETTLDITQLTNNKDFLYTDEIVFESGSTSQKVNLVTLVKDAYFIFPNKENNVYETVPLGVDSDGNTVSTIGRNLSHSNPDNGDEYTFKTDKPYVVYGYAAVAQGETLTIPEGAKVHFHSESGLIVQPGATLNIVGGVSTFDDEGVVIDDNEVTFEGDRLEPDFEDIPGQWGTIWLRQGSINNNINHLTLKNAVVGLLVENCALNIKNSQIYNCANLGILGREASITGVNLAMNYAGQACFAGTIGGNYNFNYCTFNNNWSSPKQVAVQIDNYEEDPVTKVKTPKPLATNFRNSIIYGSNQVEVFIDIYENDTFLPLFDHCLVKFNDAGTTLANVALYDAIRNEDNIYGNIKSQDPKFKNVDRNWLNIPTDSPAFEKGLANEELFDILGKTRTNPTDIGAYKAVVFPN